MSELLFGRMLQSLMPNYNDTTITATIKVIALAVGYLIGIIFLGAYLVVRDGVNSAQLLTTLTQLILGNGAFLTVIGIADIAKQTLVARGQLTTQRTQIVASTVPGSPVPPPSTPPVTQAPTPDTVN